MILDFSKSKNPCYVQHRFCLWIARKVLKLPLLTVEQKEIIVPILNSKEGWFTGTTNFQTYAKAREKFSWTPKTVEQELMYWACSPDAEKAALMVFFWSFELNWFQDMDKLEHRETQFGDGSIDMYKWWRKICQDWIYSASYSGYDHEQAVRAEKDHQ